MEEGWIWVWNRHSPKIKQELTPVSSRLNRAQMVLKAPTVRNLLIKMKVAFILVSQGEKHAKGLAWSIWDFLKLMCGFEQLEGWAQPRGQERCFGVRQAWIQILTLPFPHCLTLQFPSCLCASIHSVGIGGNDTHLLHITFAKFSEITSVNLLSTLPTPS